MVKAHPIRPLRRMHLLSRLFGGASLPVGAAKFDDAYTVSSQNRHIRGSRAWRACGVTAGRKGTSASGARVSRHHTRDLVAQTAVAAARPQVETYPVSRRVYHAPRLVAFARISPKRGASPAPRFTTYGRTFR